MEKIKELSNNLLFYTGAISLTAITAGVLLNLIFPKPALAATVETPSLPPAFQKLLYPVEKSKSVEIKTPHTVEFITDSNGNKIEILIIPANIKIHANKKEKKENSIVYLHGNWGRNPDIIKALSEMGYNVYSPAFPGYSNSTGTPNTASINNSAVLTMEYLKKNKKIPLSKTIIIGHSLGGSPVLFLSTLEKYGQAKLATINTFSSITDIFNEKFNHGGKQDDTFTRSVHPSREYAKNALSPISLFHSINDEVIPFTHSEKLGATLGERGKVFSTTGTHGTPDMREIMKILEGNVPIQENKIHQGNNGGPK